MKETPGGSVGKCAGLAAGRQTPGEKGTKGTCGCSGLKGTPPCSGDAVPQPVP